MTSLPHIRQRGFPSCFSVVVHAVVVCACACGCGSTPMLSWGPRQYYLVPAAVRMCLLTMGMRPGT
jgi:hypothetical protein